jgi:hypothetical protein
LTSGDKTVAENKERARVVVRHFALNMKKNLFAPHIYYPQFMSPENGDENNLALDFCKNMLKLSTTVVIYGIERYKIKYIMEDNLNSGELQKTAISWAIDAEILLAREMNKRIIVVENSEHGFGLLDIYN